MRERVKEPGPVSLVKYVKGLGLTFPAKKEVVKNTMITAAVMLAGGKFLFIIDTASMYLFAISG